jgi:hypothetical protein
MAWGMHMTNYMLRKSVRDELDRRGITFNEYLAEQAASKAAEKLARTADDANRQREVRSAGPPSPSASKEAAKEAARVAEHQAKMAERQAKDATRRESGELPPVGSSVLYTGKTTWGTMDYYATPDGGVWIKKGGVIGRVSEFHVEFEQQARGAVGRQGRGGKQQGAIAYATVTCGRYVKAHKIETMYAGVGSHVFADAREAAIRANTKAAGAALSGPADRISVRAPGGAAPGQPARAAEDIAGQLVKLAELRDAGIVTADEFAAKKAELLARM